jgi:uncharacterized protein (TIGR02996 family)
MTTEEALLAAIWESPHDDLPRLVYADFLEETGDPAKAARAEFIRVQCELARMEEFDGRRGPLEGVEKELLGTWGESFRPYLPSETTGVRYDRGFALPNTRISIKRLCNRGPKFLANAPLWAFEFCLNDGGGRFQALTRTDKLRRASYIQFCVCRHQHRHEYGHWLAEADCFANLRHINLGGALDGDTVADQFEAFCGAANLPLLDRLSLYGERITEEAVHHLTDAPFAPGLRVLSMSSLGQLSPDGFSRLIAAPTLAGLQEFHASGLGGQNPNDHLRAFGQRSQLSNLKRLSLFVDGAVEGVADVLRQWPGALRLEVLSLGRCADEVVRSLIAARVFPNLRRLSVHIPGYSTAAQLVTESNEIIFPGRTIGDPAFDLIQFAKNYGVTLLV